MVVSVHGWAKFYCFVGMEFSWLLFWGRFLKSLISTSYSWGRIFVTHEFHEHWSLINNDDDDATVAAVWSWHLPGLGWTYRITVAGTVRLSNRLVAFSTIPSLSDSHSCHKTLYLSYTLYHLADDWTLRSNRKFIIVHQWKKPITNVKSFKKLNMHYI